MKDETSSNSGRRAKACDNCRALKVRCLPSDPTDPSEPCVRCLKGNKACIFHIGPRKRSKKTDARVASLEKKLEILSAALHQQNERDPSTVNPSFIPGKNPTSSKEQDVDGTAYSHGHSKESRFFNSALNGALDENSSDAHYQPSPLSAHQISTTESHDSAYYSGPSSTGSAPGSTIGSAGAHLSSVPGSGPGSAQEPGSGVPQTSTSATVPDTSASSSSGRETIDRMLGGSTYHPTLNGSHEELAVRFEDGDIQVQTGVDVEAMREEMVISWNELANRSSTRVHHLTTTSMNLPRTPSFDRDVVSLGIITRDNAQERLNFYRTCLYSTYPMVSVPDIPLDDLRRDLPKLFIAVMATSSLGMTDPNQLDTGLILYNHAYETIIYDAMIAGSKTFELLQSLILLIFWYNEPDFYHHHKSHLLVNLAVSIASDLGIGGMVVSTRHVSLRFERIVSPQVLVDPRTLECRQMWLLIYCSCMNMINFVRRPHFFLWTPYTEECCDVIEKSDLSADHKRLAFYARMAHVLEEISKSLYCGQLGSRRLPLAEDPTTIYLVEYFERQLTEIYERAKKCSAHTGITMWAYFQSIRVYLYQVVIYVPYEERLGRSPFTEFSLGVMKDDWNPGSIKILLDCFGACMSSLETYRKLTPLQVCVMPLFNYSRLVFCVALLLKLRVLSLLNPEIKQICPVKQKHFDILFDILGRLNDVAQKYPFSNNIICFNFVIKLLMCHFDRQVHYLYLDQECQKNPQDMKVVEADNRIRLTRSIPRQETEETSPSQAHNPPTIGGPVVPEGQYLLRPTAPDFGMPNSPLNILSEVSSQQEVSMAQPPLREKDEVPNNGGNVNGTSSLNGGVTNGEVPCMVSLNDVDSLWLTGDDFWRELIPNVEAFTNFDI